MADFFVIAMKGVEFGDTLDSMSKNVAKYASMAINKTLPYTRKKAAASMERQINFPRGYLTGDNGRLSIASYASEGNLQGAIRGRDQPTSLARFVVGGAKVSKTRGKGVHVEVDPGKAKEMPSAFVIKLRNNNLGLAYRTKSGKAPNSVGAKLLAPGLYLLFGPSVDQVFNKTREMVADDAEAFLNAEFLRLFKAGI